MSPWYVNASVAFAELLEPLTIISAVCLPLLRIGLRKWRKHPLPVVDTLVVHDIAAGLTLPSFIALALSGLIPDFMSHIEPHMLKLAGFLGVIHTMKEVCSRQHRRADDFLLKKP